MAKSAKRPGYTDRDGVRKFPYQYSANYQHWFSATKSGNKKDAEEAGARHARQFGLNRFGLNRSDRELPQYA